MRRFYFLFVILGLIIPFSVCAKEVKLVTNDIKATYVGIDQEYGIKIVPWEEDGTATATLTNKQGLNVNLQTGYVSRYIKVNEEQVVGSYSGNFYLSPDMLPDGCTVEIMTAKREAINVVILGNPNEIKVNYMFHDYLASEWSGNKLVVPITDTNLNVTISARSGYILSSVMNNDLDVLGDDKRSFIITTIGLRSGDNTFEVESLNITSSRTSEFSVDVIGDPNSVVLSLAGERTFEYTGEALKEPIKFNPSFDFPIYIENKNYLSTLYNVSVDGVTVPARDGRYVIDEINDGGVIKVEVDFPNKDIPVRFNFVNPETDGAISVVMRDNNVVPREEWLSEGWSVKMGSYVYMEFDTADYSVEASVNGIALDNSYTSFTALDENGYDVEITAVPHDPFNVTINYASLPAHFKVRIGTNGDEYVEMTGRDSTKIKVPRNKNRIYIMPDEGWILDGISVDGKDSYSNDVVITGNTDVDVFIKEFVRDLEAVVYVDPATDWNYRGLTLSPEVLFQEKNVILQDGYNILKYNELDLPIRVEVTWDGNYNYPAFLNGEQLPMPVLYISELVPGSVVRFYGSEPEYYKVDFEIEENLPFTMYKDLLDPVENADAQEVLAGTRFDIIAEDPSEICVKVNGTSVSAEDDRYTVNVNEDIKISISKNNPDSVHTILDAVNGDVYSLQGIRIMKGMNEDMLKNLPAGIYIINGKKVKINN